jgi:putative transposase
MHAVHVPRGPRAEEPGTTYHVTIHSIHGATIVCDDSDRRRLLKTIATVVARYGWICLAFCILDNHYHLLVTTPEPNLGEGMRLLNASYAQDFNRRHGRRGHVFRERYGDKKVVTDEHLLLTVRYIALNPVEAGLAADAGSFRWSSYPGVVGLTRCWPFIANGVLLEHFGSGEAAIRIIRDFVEGEPSSSEKAA